MKRRALNQQFGMLLLSVLAVITATGQAANSSEWDITGSRWRLTYTSNDGDREFVLDFAKGGTLRAFRPDGTVYGSEETDTWEQDGKELYFYFTNRYSSYAGKFLTVNLIEGTAKNVRNLSWEFELTRIK